MIAVEDGEFEFELKLREAPPCTVAVIVDGEKSAPATVLELIRKMEPEQRAAKAIRMTTRLVRECKAAIRRNHPEYSEEEVGIAFIESNYGKELANEVRSHLRQIR